MIFRKAIPIIRTWLQWWVTHLGRITVCQNVIIGQNENLSHFFHQTTQSPGSDVTVTNTHATWDWANPTGACLQRPDPSGLHNISGDPIKDFRHSIFTQYTINGNLLCDRTDNTKT